jgi:hypothetical protein
VAKVSDDPQPSGHGAGTQRFMKKRMLTALVKYFLVVEAPKGAAEISHWQRVSLPVVLSDAGRGNDHSGKRHPHLTRLQKSALLEARRRLMSNQDLFRSCRSFHEVLETVRRLTDDIWGYKEMAEYDTAMAIGAHLGLLPERIYLHRGTRQGAANMGLDVRHREYLEVAELPKELTVLEPYQIEDFFCFFEDVLRPLVGPRSEAA